MTTNAATMTTPVASNTTATISNSLPVNDDRPAKPSYAQMAQRARERFEKERQESIEKEQRRKVDPAALSAANKHNMATGLPPKEVRPQRDGSKTTPREKFVPVEQRDRFRRPRVQKENEFRRELWAKSPK